MDCEFRSLCSLSCWVRFRNLESWQGKVAGAHKCQLACCSEHWPGIRENYMTAQVIRTRQNREGHSTHHRSSKHLAFPISGSCMRSFPSNKRNPFKRSAIVWNLFLLLLCLQTNLYFPFLFFISYSKIVTRNIKHYQPFFLILF